MELRAKHVDDLTVGEVIPWTSIGMLPVVANEIGTFAMQHGIPLNDAKCKDMLIDFLRFRPFPTSRYTLMAYNMCRLLLIRYFAYVV